VFDEKGNVRKQFILSAAQSKGEQTRTVYLNQRFRKALLEYIACIRITDPQHPLFESQKGGHFLANTMSQLFLDIYKAVSLKDASSHSGRRTYITRLANKGVGKRLLAELAGHPHISTTQRYIDVNAEQLSEAVELLWFCEGLKNSQPQHLVLYTNSSNTFVARTSHYIGCKIQVIDILIKKSPFEIAQKGNASCFITQNTVTIL
jgi:integrase/recombinase XerD